MSPDDGHVRDGFSIPTLPGSQRLQSPGGDICQLMFVHWDWKVPKSCKWVMKGQSRAGRTGWMVSAEAESAQKDADCKKAMGREFKVEGWRVGIMQALTLHRAGKLINGLLTEAWNSRTKQVTDLQPTTILGRTSSSLHSPFPAPNPCFTQTHPRCYCSGCGPCVLASEPALMSALLTKPDHHFYPLTGEALPHSFTPGVCLPLR